MRAVPIRYDLAFHPHLQLQICAYILINNFYTCYINLDLLDLLIYIKGAFFIARERTSIDYVNN